MSFRFSIAAALATLLALLSAPAAAQVTKYDTFFLLGTTSTADATWQVVVRPRPEGCADPAGANYNSDTFSFPSGTAVGTVASRIGQAIDLAKPGFPTQVFPYVAGATTGSRLAKQWVRSLGVPNGWNVCVSVNSAAFVMIIGATPSATGPTITGNVTGGGLTFEPQPDEIKRKLGVMQATSVPALPVWGMLILLAGLACLSVFFSRRMRRDAGGTVG